MAYVKEPFTYDLFVSYSHADDGTGQSRLKQWSQAFIEELKSELKVGGGDNDSAEAREFRNTLNIFLDDSRRVAEQLDPLAPLTQKLRSNVEQSAILMVLMSEDYLQSAWCAKEREWWLAHQLASGFAHEGRIAVAKVLPTASDWPAGFKDEAGEPLPGFCFYDVAAARDEVRPYEWPAPDAKSKGPFREQVVALAGRLRKRLKEVKALAKARADRRLEAARIASPRAIYLHARAEAAAAWKRAADALRDSGYVVLPDEMMPVEGDETNLKEIQRKKKLRIEIMSGCDAVLLVAPPETLAANADIVVVGRNERHSACARAERNFLPCALLDGVPIVSPGLRQTAAELDVQWLDVTREPWTPTVQDWLRRSAEKAGGDDR